ncbi:MAG: leucine-rich repeat domain-containing protein, partial [Candidatus Sigynarchaeota archaeon]
RKWLSPAEEVLAHASNLQAWVENDYDTRLLHANIAFPLLKELARAGDEKATRVLDAEIETRLRSGNQVTRQFILETCGDIIQDPALLVPFIDDISIYAIVLRILARLAREGNDDAYRAIEPGFRRGPGSMYYIHVKDWWRVIRDPALLGSLLHDERTKHGAMAGLARLAREGNAEAARIVDADIESRLQAISPGVPSDLVEYYLDRFTENQWLALATKNDLDVALYGILTPRVLEKLDKSRAPSVQEALEYRYSIGYLERPPVVRIEARYAFIGREGLLLDQESINQVETLGNEHLVTAISNRYGRPAGDLAGINKFTNLGYFCFCNCGLSSLPDLTGLNNLKEIIVNENYLRGVEELASAPNLRIIEASENSIESLRGIENLVHLEKVDFIENRLRSFPDVSRLTSLKELFLSGNEIATISEAQLESLLKIAPHLETLHMIDNPVNEDITFIKYLEKELKKRNPRIDFQAYNN